MYLARDAALLVGVPGDRIGQWARWGHIRASVSDGEPHVYAFEDVAEALAVRLLLDAGFTLPVVRRAVDRVGGEHPLSGGRLHVVDGRLAIERGEVLEDVFTSHGVLPLDGRIDGVALLRAGGWASLVTGITSVEVDPARLNGAPCLRGRRVPIQDVVEDPSALDVTDAEIADAQRWWECAA